MVEPANHTNQHSDDSETAFLLMEAGVPLTLLLDLATPIHSDDVYHNEPGETDWLASGVA